MKHSLVTLKVQSITMKKQLRVFFPFTAVLQLFKYSLEKKLSELVRKDFLII